MKVGSLVFSTDQGLGILAKAFYDHGIVTHPVVVAHGKRQEHPEWFPDAPRVTDLRRERGILMEFCASMDAMLFFETPFDWTLISHCRDVGVKTVISVMHECMPEVLPELPDLWLCPSLLDLRWAGRHRERPAIFLPVPVEQPWKVRTRAKVFVHNAGHGGLKGRNGTQQVLEATRLVSSPARFIVRSQDSLPYQLPGNVELRIGNFPRETLYDEGDVFLFPERFNGLSLPLQESYAAGMLVMAGDRFPMNTWLPKEPLIPVSGYARNRVAQRCAWFDDAVIDPADIVRAIDLWYDRDITSFSERGRQWAEENLWEKLKPRYIELLGG